MGFFVQRWLSSPGMNPLPQIFYAVRRWLLWRPLTRVGIMYPWRVTIGNNLWIGDNVKSYSLGPTAAYTVISVTFAICTADHDVSDIGFPIRDRTINIGQQVSIASDA
jgi:putative colanic acid biosynthesis acetyltransferase WcaF